jgi:hypothetical protein
VVVKDLPCLSDRKPLSGSGRGEEEERKKKKKKEI